MKEGEKYKKKKNNNNHNNNHNNNNDSNENNWRKTMQHDMIEKGDKTVGIQDRETERPAETDRLCRPTSQYSPHTHRYIAPSLPLRENSIATPCSLLCVRKVQETPGTRRALHRWQMVRLMLGSLQKHCDARVCVCVGLCVCVCVSSF